MPEMDPTFKSELLAAANASLQRHFARVDEDLKRQAATVPPPSDEMLADFTQHLKSSKRILCLFGAGLSASSGIPTYRGANGFWRGSYSDQQLATPGAFRADPCLVWQFYEDQRAKAKAAEPNAAHFALAALAQNKGPDMLAVNQNVDGLCERAGHPIDHLVGFHGSLFHVRCVDEQNCGYEADAHEIPIVPALAPSPTPEQDQFQRNTALTIDDLPHCPRCKNDNLLRPSVIWFGEGVPEDRVARVQTWLDADSGNDDNNKLDLMLVVGTSAMVRPASGYIEKARARGARVAFFNYEVRTAGVARPEDGDWSFVGDAAELVPLALGDFGKAPTQVDVKSAA